MRTPRPPRTLAAAGLTAAASVLSALTTGTAAHADVTGTNMTVPGNNFQVGQTYTVVIVTDDCTEPVLTDTVDGVVYPVYDPNASSSVIGPCGPDVQETETVHWTPLIPGTHVLGYGYGGNDRNLPPDTGLATATVPVGGTSSTDPVSCGTTGSGAPCLTVHGTAEVGCALTLTMSNIPPSMAPGFGSSLIFGLAAGGSLTRTASVTDGNGAEIGPTPITGTSVTFTWTPDAPGYHHLTGEFDTGQMPPLISDDPVTPAGSAGTMYLPVAAAGTQACA